MRFHKIDTLNLTFTVERFYVKEETIAKITRCFKNAKSLKSLKLQITVNNMYDRDADYESEEIDQLKHA